MGGLGGHVKKRVTATYSSNKIKYRTQKGMWLPCKLFLRGMPYEVQEVELYAMCCKDKFSPKQGYKSIKVSLYTRRCVAATYPGHAPAHFLVCINALILTQSALCIPSLFTTRNVCLCYILLQHIYKT